VSRAWTHWATSDDLLALRVPSHDAGTGLAGRPLGRARRGGDFALDPFDAYRAELVTNPNVVVAGAIGAGKSTVVKMLVERGLERGRRAVVVDPKGEYGALAASHGVAPAVLGRDAWCDVFPDDDREARGLIAALVASALGRPLATEDHYAIDEAWSALPTPRPRRVLAALHRHLAPHRRDRAPSGRRTLAHVTHRFVEGDLGGLFDGPGEPLTLRNSLVVLDLSSQWASSSLPVAALSAMAAAQRLVGSGSAGYLVLDEAWALLADPAALRWLQGSWKLARARGLSHVLVLHRWSDVAAAGEAGSAQRERAAGLLRECETVWLFRQPPDETRDLVAALALSPLEAGHLPALARGTALVRYGRHRSLVRVSPDRRDRGLVDTDSAMREGP